MIFCKTARCAGRAAGATRWRWSPLPLLLAAAGWCRSKRWLLLLWVAGITVIFAFGLALIFPGGWVPATATTAALWTAAVVMELGRRHTLELAERQRIRSTMGLYFSPRVLRDVLENPARLEPRQVEITALPDKPSALLAERCRAFAVSPPGEWTGIYRLETK